MGEKSQKVKAKQNHREILIAMSEIVFEIVAMVFEGVMAFVFIFPSSATGTDDLSHVLVRDSKVCDECRFIKDFASFFVEHGDFAPIDTECIVTSSKR